MKTVTITYLRKDERGEIERGVATVPCPVGRSRPSWADCARAIPGYITAQRLS